MFFAFLGFFKFCPKTGKKSGQKSKANIKNNREKDEKIRKNEGTSKIIGKKTENQILLQHIRDFPPI